MARPFRPLSPFQPWSWQYIKRRFGNPFACGDGGRRSPRSAPRVSALPMAGRARAAQLVGSSNLDPLSMRRNYELNVIVADVETGAAMREMFARDLTEATRIHAVEWRRRPAWQRTAEAMASYFSPNL